MCSLEPPTALLITFVGVPQSTFVPPQGPAFCGSPRSLSTSHDVGSSSLKCAWATVGTIPASTPASDAETNKVRVGLLIMSFQCGNRNGTPQPSRCKGPIW